MGGNQAVLAGNQEIMLEVAGRLLIHTRRGNSMVFIFM